MYKGDNYELLLEGNELIKNWVDTLSKEYGKAIIIQIYLDFANFILLFQFLPQCVMSTT